MCEPTVHQRRVAPRQRSPWLTLSVVCLVSILMSLNMNMLNIALPIVSQHFDASSTQSSWLVLSFMLTSCALMVPAGRLTDVIGQRKLYLWGYLFSPARVSCADWHPISTFSLGCG